MRLARGFRRHASHGNAEALTQELDTAFGDLARVVGGGLVFPGMDDKGRVVQTSNLDVAIAKATFADADSDVFLVHGLGVVAPYFWAVRRNSPATFYDGSRLPSTKGTWVRSDTAGVTGTFLLFGPREKR
jgi:hypothetical protein